MQENQTAKTFVEFSNVGISYRDVPVLRNIDLKVEGGQIVYLVGRVGCGKTTLLKSLYAESQVRAGEAMVLGYDLTNLDPKDVPYLRRRLGIVFQDFKLLTDRSVNDNLRFVLNATDTVDEAAVSQRIREVLEFVGMQSKGYKMPHELSGGEQQRIVIARALLNNPMLLLADEPTGNLDARTGDELMQLIYQIAGAGTAVLMATHNMRWIKRYPGRVLNISNGEVAEIAAEELERLSPDDLYNL